MKKTILTFLVVIISTSSTLVFGQHLTMSPEKIVPGEKVLLTYDPQGTELEGLEMIITNAFLFDNDKPSAVEISMTLDQGKFTGSFSTDASTKAVLFSFTSEDLEKQDNNDKKGYKTICYQEDRKTPVQGAYVSKAYIVGTYSWMADLDRNNEKAFKLLGKEFENHPTSADNLKYQSFYASLAKANKDETAMMAAKESMKKIMTKKKVSEEELNYAHTLSSRIVEDNESTEMLKSKLLKKYPNGIFAANDLSGEIRKAKEVKEKVVLFEKFNKKFKDTESYENTKNYLANQIALAYSKEKDWENFRKYFSMITSNSSKAGSLNSIAWPMSGESLEGEAGDVKKGRALSKESLELLSAEMKDMKDKPAYFTERQYQRNLTNSYAMFADTYALLAYKDGDAKDALHFQKISCENAKFKNAEMNQRYCVYFEAINTPEETEKLVEGMIVDGNASSMMKAQHKRLFLANNTLENAYDKYVVELEKAAKANLKEELIEKMLDMPAPDFKLVNLEGSQVSLESLKGKVVIVDFWATWCGPCKASFPGMQKAVNKFENSDDVAFVFIDTWESGEEKEKNATEFINSKNYSFNVLMDNENKVVADFGVSGIPTKFILDKEGIIRFKSVGFGGNDEKLVDELSLMIEIVGGSEPMRITGTPKP
jgi:thiol-disulfide isomerase/thioredoxin